MGNEHTPICVICNNPIPANITPTPVASCVVATHQVDLVAHPSCAIHGKPAYEVGRREPSESENMVAALVSLADSFQEGSPYTYPYQEETLLRDAAFTIEQLRPIPVSERLPENGATVLGWESSGDGDGNWYDVDFNEDRWWCNYHDRQRNDYITHWLPLPPKPE